MEVTFVRRARRYEVAIRREHGAALVPRTAPGFDERMPHDLAHYLVEEQLGLELAVFGQLAAGGEGVFVPAPADRSVTSRRTAARLAAAGRDDMRRSEAAVGECVAAWSGRPGARPAGLTAAERARVVRRLDEVAAQWSTLPDGGSLTFVWPHRPRPGAGRRVRRRRGRDPGRRAGGAR